MKTEEERKEANRKATEKYRRKKGIKVKGTKYATKEEKLEAKRKAVRKWEKNNPDKIRNKDLKRQFGITLEDYNQMFNKQKGKCLICDTHQNECKKALHVDHCHETGKVRGLLCHNCNVGLGNFKDNIELLNKAIKYLKNGN